MTAPRWNDGDAWWAAFRAFSDPHAAWWAAFRASSQGHTAGDRRTSPRETTPSNPSGSSLARLVRRVLSSRRRPDAWTARGDARTEGVYVFHPPAIDQAIDRNLDALARIDTALRAQEMDAALRDVLLLIATDVRISNQKLSAVLDACPLCGTAAFKRVCRNCGNRRNP